MNDTTTTQDAGAPRGAASFCIPRTVIEALLDAQADALMIGAYLTLARFTEATGVYSTASVNAISKATGSFKPRVEAALTRLKAVRAFKLTRVSNGRTGKYHALVNQKEDLGPILFDRESWAAETGEELPDGPLTLARVRHVLPAFDEDLTERVWMDAGLVAGFGDFKQPLKALKNAGDTAARLLLSMYAAHDLEGWGGVSPVGPRRGPWRRYEPVPRQDDDGNDHPENRLIHGGGRLVRWTGYGPVANIDARVGETAACWDAIHALESAGLVYETVLVVNRDPVKAKFSSGDEYSGIDANAEPFYELDTRSRHGFKPAGEEGLASVTADTASKLKAPVTKVETGEFWAYAAIVPRGFGCHVIGVFRLRFRVANPKNSGVRGAWARIHQNNRDALAFINSVRKANDLPEMPAPWDQAKAAKSRKAAMKAEQTGTAPAPWLQAEGSPEAPSGQTVPGRNDDEACPF